MGGRAVAALFFFPRGGSSHVARALAESLPQAGWETTLVAGSLGAPGEATHAPTFFSGLDVRPVDYTPAASAADPLAAPLPFQPSYEDRPGAPDRVFASVDDGPYERLVAAWTEALAAAGAASADVLHLHHLTPANEAAARAFPTVPAVGQLHGTELAMLREIDAGLPQSWTRAAVWAERMRGWAQACARLLVPPGSEDEVCSLLGVERRRLTPIPNGVELDRFRPRPLPRAERAAFWRERLCVAPRGWDESGVPGSVAYSDEELAPLDGAALVSLYVGRYTAVKRIPLLVAAHVRARARIGAPAPLVLVGGHPGEWEGEHPRAAIERLGDREAFLAGWYGHDELPELLNAADLLVLPSVAEAFGLVLVEAMACGLPVVAVDAHGPAEIVAPGTGWLVPSDDEAGLADALVAAADAHERLRRGERALAHARAAYGREAIAARVAGVYAAAAHG